MFRVNEGIESSSDTNNEFSLQLLISMQMFYKDEVTCPIIRNKDSKNMMNRVRCLYMSDRKIARILEKIMFQFDVAVWITQTNKNYHPI